MIDSATPITITATALQWSVVMTALWKAPLSVEVALPLIQMLEAELKRTAPQPNGGAMTESAHVQD